MSRSLPLNEAGVDDVLASIDSPVCQNLVRIAVASARMKLMRQTGQSVEDWEAHLPDAPFDFAFFAQVISEAFKDEQTVRAVLDGATIEDATGWNI